MFRIFTRNRSLALLAVLTALTSAQLAQAGRVNGPGVDYQSVDARSIRTYTITFEGGLPAEISVIGDGDTDLDLFVYDENGNLVASDEDITDWCHVRWRPRWTGRFTVRVVNLGHVYNEYVLRTN